MIVAGLFLLLVGGGLTLLSYLYRDPQTGVFVVWYGTLICGAVNTFVGFLWREKENEPFI